MSAENLRNTLNTEAQIQQAETELNEAKKTHTGLYKQAESIQAELHALKNFLLDPSEDMTVAELRFIEQRKSILEIELAVKWREMASLYHLIKDANGKVEELSA